MEIQGYVPEIRFSLVFVDVIRQNVDGNTRLLFGNRFSLVSADVFRPRGDWNTRFCSRNTFFSCFLYISDSFSTRYSWSSFFHYRTGKYVVIVRFYTTHTRILPSICEIYASLCKITQIQELYFLHSFNKFIWLFSFSSIDRPVIINYFLF